MLGLLGPERRRQDDDAADADGADPARPPATIRVFGQPGVRRRAGAVPDRLVRRGRRVPAAPVRAGEPGAVLGGHRPAGRRGAPRRGAGDRRARRRGGPAGAHLQPGHAAAAGDRPGDARAAGPAGARRADQRARPAADPRRCARCCAGTRRPGGPSWCRATCWPRSSRPATTWSSCTTAGWSRPARWTTSSPAAARPPSASTSPRGRRTCSAVDGVEDVVVDGPRCTPTSTASPAPRPSRAGPRRRRGASGRPAAPPRGRVPAAGRRGVRPMSRVTTAGERSRPAAGRSRRDDVQPTRRAGGARRGSGARPSSWRRTRWSVPRAPDVAAAGRAGPPAAAPPDAAGARLPGAAAVDPVGGVRVRQRRRRRRRARASSTSPPAAGRTSRCSRCSPPAASCCRDRGAVLRRHDGGRGVVVEPAVPARRADPPGPPAAAEGDRRRRCCRWSRCSCCRPWRWSWAPSSTARATLVSPTGESLPYARRGRSRCCWPSATWRCTCCWVAGAGVPAVGVDRRAARRGRRHGPGRRSSRRSSTRSPRWKACATTCPRTTATPGPACSPPDRLGRHGPRRVLGGRLRRCSSVCGGLAVPAQGHHELTAGRVTGSGRRPPSGVPWRVRPNAAAAHTTATPCRRPRASGRG